MNRKLSLLVAAVTILVAVSGVVRAFSGTPAGSVRGVVAFIGDSNIVYGANRRDMIMTPSEIGYVPIDMAAAGAAIRWNGCRSTGPCPNPAFLDYWKTRIPLVRSKLNPDAYVVELGINDTGILGTASTRGYANYGTKIDYIMGLLPTNRPILWTNLPCSLEPSQDQTGCGIINTALSDAKSRWPNLTIVGWCSAAKGHPEYMKPSNIHYTDAGNDAYTNLVVAVLNTKLP